MLGTTSFNNFTFSGCVCPKSNIQIGKLAEKINYYVCVTRRDNMLEKHVEVYQRHR